MKSTQVIHRDIKPANILLSQTEPLNLKLGDFGPAAIFGDSRLQYRCGIPQYITPKVVLMQEASFATGLWSIAATLYAIKYGIVPFVGISKDALYAKMSSMSYM